MSFDLKSFVAGQVREVAQTYAQDLGFVSEEKCAECPGGKARTPLAFSAEVAGFNQMVGKVLRGEEADFSMPDVANREEATQLVTSSAEELASLVEGMNEDELTRPITMPWGQPMPALGAVMMAAGHMSYHDGQINYLQTLYGDDVDHWRSN